MNSDLINLLLNPGFFSERYTNPDTKYNFDDFDPNKRKNRLFTSKQKDLCWNKAMLVPERNPDRWRYDAAGNLVLKSLKGCNGPLCHEYDHIVPFSKGGETTIRNCQILQSSANKFKSNKTGIDNSILKEKSSKINLSEYEMDLVELAIYGNVSRKYY
jgi:hypothetical protein